MIIGVASNGDDKKSWEKSSTVPWFPWKWRARPAYDAFLAFGSIPISQECNSRHQPPPHSANTRSTHEHARYISTPLLLPHADPARPKLQIGRGGSEGTRANTCSFFVEPLATPSTYNGLWISPVACWERARSGWTPLSFIVQQWGEWVISPARGSVWPAAHTLSLLLSLPPHVESQPAHHRSLYLLLC